MDSFYIIVGSIALLLLIGVLTFLGIAMNKQYVSRPYPSKSIQKCPDYWEVADDGKCVIPTSANARAMNNVGDLASSRLVATKNRKKQYDRLYTPGLSEDKKSIDFEDEKWNAFNTMVGTNLNPLCQKKLWFNDHNVVWDGISNGNLC